MEISKLFLCLTIIVSLIQPAASLCRSWETEINSVCYSLSNDAKTWTQAVISCEGIGSRLVVIDSASKQADVQTFLSTLGWTSQAWAGATDIIQNNVWYWNDYSGDFNYSNWKTGEPNGGTVEHCLLIDLASASNEWVDVPCDIAFNFVCEGRVSPFQWSYHGTTGPEYWADYYSSCASTNTRQSPIDIVPADATQDLALGQFTFTGYSDIGALTPTLLNNGRTVKINLGTPGAAYISGGGLDGNYVAAEINFHWGKTSIEGSEHTRQGQKFPLEMQIVHYKESYGNMSTALGNSDGLAVLGFWFTIGPQNDNLNSLINGLANVRYSGDSQIYNGTSITELMPANTNKFYRYLGGLTSPSCDEVVIWSVFKNKGSLSETQMAVFRNLFENVSGEESIPLIDNYRPTLGLTGRTVSKNF